MTDITSPRYKLNYSQVVLAEAKRKMTEAIEAYQAAAYENVEAQAYAAAAQGFSRERFVVCKMHDIHMFKAHLSGGAESPHNVAEAILREATAAICNDLHVLGAVFPRDVVS